jgi:hypothetical protein
MLMLFSLKEFDPTRLQDFSNQRLMQLRCADAKDNAANCIRLICRKELSLL